MWTLIVCLPCFFSQYPWWLKYATLEADLGLKLNVVLELFCNKNKLASVK